KTRFTLAMACIRLWPFIILSTYIVWAQGASNPVSHISRTITICSGSSGVRKRFFMASIASLVRICGFQAGGSLLMFPVIITAISGHSLSALSALYIFTQFLRLIHTIIALPSRLSVQFGRASRRERVLLG